MLQMLENFLKTKSDATLNELYEYVFLEGQRAFGKPNTCSPEEFIYLIYSRKIEEASLLIRWIIKFFSIENTKLSNMVGGLENCKHIFYEIKKEVEERLKNKEIWLEELQEKVMNQKLERDIILDIKEKELKEREADLIESWKRLEEARVLFIKSTI